MPNRIHLTDIVVRSLPPSDQYTTYWDRDLRAFGVRVGKHSKTFIVIKDGGKRIALGKYPETSLKIARERARAALYDTKPSVSPAVSLKTSDAIELFLETRAAKNRHTSVTEASRLLRKHVLPDLGEKQLGHLTTSDITGIVDELLESPSTAMHVHVAAKTFLNWAVARRYIQHSPLAGLPLPVKPFERDRILTDAELVAVYRAAQQMGHPFGYIVLLCIHTLLRRNEVARLKWEYITPDFITIPASISKSRRKHVLPNLIAADLADVPRTSEYLFPSAAGTSFSAWSKSKAKLDKLCRVTGWTLHDLRRTGRSKLAEWQCCAPDIAERILGHVTAQTRLERIYNRWHALPQIRDGMERYEQRLTALLSSH